MIALGVDGGGTGTRAVLVDATGTVLGAGRGGPGNYHNVGATAAAESIGAAIAGAWRSARRPPRPADAACVGVGRLVSERDREVIRGIVRERSLARADRVVVSHDLRVALAGGLAGASGMVLVAGTGAACYGRSRAGAEWRAGGWGPVLSDEGSAYWLGREALVAAVREVDGRGRATALSRGVVDALALDRMESILRRVDAEGMSRRAIAALAPLVTEAAGRGDAVALGILDRGCDELSRMVEAVAGRLTFEVDPVPVVITGGLTAAGDGFLEPLRGAIRRRVRSAEPVTPRMAPVLGAAWLALEAAGESLDAGCVDRLIGSGASIVGALPSRQAMDG